MNKLPTIMQGEFIPNLKINLELVEAFFKYLPYKKKGDLKYILSYYHQVTHQLKNVLEIISNVEKCIQYQINENKEIKIPAEIVFQQEVTINGKEINLFYHGQLIVNDTSAHIFWNWFQNTPKVEFKLIDVIYPSKILTLFENFQTAITDIETKYE